MKQKIISIIVIFCGSISIVALLFFSETQSKNGFNRNYRPIDIIISSQTELGSGNYIISGKTSSDIFCKDFKTPLLMIKWNRTTKHLSKMPIVTSINLSGNYINHSHHSGKFYLSDMKGNLCKIQSGQTNQSHCYRVDTKFDQCFFLSESTAIVRERNLEKRGADRQLTKISLSDPNQRLKNFLLPNKSEEIFGSDGLLYYAPKSSHFFYSFFYEGRILCLDTNLNLIYAVKTIDTIRVPKLRTQKFEQKSIGNTVIKSTTQTNPNAIVNEFLTVNKGKVYIQSSLRADNESIWQSRKGKNIDVYDQARGSYLYSILLPLNSNQKLQSFIVEDNQLIAVIGQSLITYRGDF